MIPKTYTDEQNKIVEYIRDGYNVSVNAVPGSGKTTTAIHIANQLCDKNILLLTYSKNLKMDARKKSTTLDLDNLEVHSFHSFAVKYFDPGSAKNILFPVQNNVQPQKQIPTYDLMIIDEIQDMTSDLNSFLLHSLKHFEPKLFCIMGDVDQCVFDFKHADKRFLILGKKLFNTNKEWIDAKLSISFRLNTSSAHFINQQLIGYNKIRAIKDGPPVNYIILNPFTHMFNIFIMIKDYLQNGYQPDDIFVLASSVKSTNPKHPMSVLENLLVMAGIPVNIQNNDDTQITPEEIKSKVTFCTFHASKGLERKIVFVYGFQDTYFKYGRKDANPLVCPDTIYVACSRTMEHLNIIHSYDSDYFKFMKPKLMINDAHINLINLCEIQTSNNSSTKPSEYKVTDIVKYLPEYLVQDILDDIQCNTVSPIGHRIDAQNIVQFEKTSENVSAIYGTAIPLKTHMLINGHDKIFEDILNYLDNYNYTDYYSRIKEIKKKYDDEIQDDQDLMFLTNIYMMMLSNYIFKIEQISNYDWVNSNAINKGVDRLINLFTDENINLSSDILIRSCLSTNISGVPDGIDYENKIIYEFKFVDELTPEYKLQLMIYAWLMEIDLNEWQLYLYNIKTNEVLELQIVTDINDMVAMIVREKIRPHKNNMNDDDFIQNFRFKKKIKLDLKKKIQLTGKTKKIDNKKIDNKKIIKKEKLYESNDYIMVFDTETTGLDVMMDCVIELGWIIYDERNDKIIKKAGKIIKNPNIFQSRLITSYENHGITCKDIKSSGFDPVNVFKEFSEDLDYCTRVLGHNTRFDIRMMLKEASDFRLKKLYDKLSSKSVLCTSKIGSRFINSTVNDPKELPDNLSNKNKGYKYKVKLNVLYTFLSNKKMHKSHRALVDSEYTLVCYLLTTKFGSEFRKPEYYDKVDLLLDTIVFN